MHALFILEEISRSFFKSKKIGGGPGFASSSSRAIWGCFFFDPLRISFYAWSPLLSLLYARSIARTGDLGLEVAAI